jgi:PEP-CTERM motif
MQAVGHNTERKTWARLPRTAVTSVCAALAAWLPVQAQAQSALPVNFAVSFNDAAGTYSSYYSDITRHVVAAGNDWISRFAGPMATTTLTVQIGFDTAVPTANGRSATSSFVASSGGVNIFEQGAAAKIKTGFDANGTAADIEFNFGTNGYLQSLWFDPNPVAQTAAVPSNRTDARSVMLHEFGHALGFNGWRSGTTGALPAPGDYQSTFDRWVLPLQPGDNTLYFTGPNAMAVYGGAVPVTFDNNFHVGNAPGRPGNNLAGDLMNGMAFDYATRYQISALDLAIMQDAGLPVAAVPEPATYALWLCGLVAVAAVRRRRATARLRP